MTLLEKKILAILSEPQLTYPHSGLPIEILYLI